MTSTDRTSSSVGGFLWHVMPALVYVALVFYGGSISTQGLPTVKHLDKVAHFFAFGGMQVLALRAQRYLWPEAKHQAQLVAAVFAASGVGALLEVYQWMLGTRSAELLDWVADTVGAVLAGVVMSLMARRMAAKAEVSPGDGGGE